MRCLRGALILSIFAVVFAADPAVSQVFGKNKVQYEALDWEVLETDHLLLHFYKEEEQLARQLAVYAESVCVEFDETFRLPPRRRIPFLLYSAHHLFQQSNATPGFISEATGGLTELIKGRVLLPHVGSWKRLKWVTKHELAHAYMLEKLARVMREHRKHQNFFPPLWFIEGLAEFTSTDWDEDAEGLLRDAVLSGRARKLTESETITGTVLMYKEGQSFLIYLADRFGAETIFDLMDNWYRAQDFETIFRMTYGMSLRDLDEDWFAELRRRYYPTVTVADDVTEVADRLTRRGHYNLGPRILPNESPDDTTLRFCYFAAGESGVDLMINAPDKRGRRRDRRVLRGGTSPSFESFHLFQTRPDVSASGLICLSSQRGGRDALYLVDSHTRKVVKRIQAPDLVAIADPALCPGDTAVVFSAQDVAGRSDLFRVRWSADDIRVDRLTDDDYDDIEPDVSPDGQYVVFASDRCDRAGNYSLFRISLIDGTIETMSEPPSGDDRQPVYSPDGEWIAYRSTRGGTSDLYVRPSAPSLESRRVTQLIGPATDPDWLPGNRGLLFTGQHSITFQTYRLEFDPDSLEVAIETPSAREPILPVASFEDEPVRYQRRLSFDLAQNAISFDPGLGTPGGAGQIALSDMLGNEQLYFYIANDSERFGDFWDGWEGGVTYINRARRLNWGVGLYRLTQVYDADLNIIRRERRFGVLGLVSYPFNKFTRVEGSVFARHANDHLLRNGEFKDVDLVSNFLAIVHDNARWSRLGPSGGTRLYLSAGFTRDLASGAGDFATLLGEARSYMQPIPQLVLATRVQGQASLWRDAQRNYLGGPNTIRGYDRRALAGHRTVLLSQELRFPLVRGLTFAVPAAWSFPTIHGALFADAAWAWDDFRVTQLGAVGAGVYIGGGYFPAIRWNFVWPTRDFTSYPSSPRTQFSIGYNF